MEEINSKEKNFIVSKVSGALLFSVFGCMGVFFSLWRQNFNSAAWCCMLQISCVMVLVFNKPYLKGELHLRYSAAFFRVMKYLAVVFCVCGWCAFATYIAVGIIKKEVFDIQSHYAASPVAFMAGFWYLVLFFDCRKYETLLE